MRVPALYLAFVCAAALALAGLVIGVAVFDRHDKARARHEREADIRHMQQVNASCAPQRVVEADYHGASWSLGPYWKVRCADGSVRVIP